MLQKAVTIASFVAVSLAFVPYAFAGETCQPQYGGECPGVKVTIDKTVMDPNTDDTADSKGGAKNEKDFVFLDNITSDDSDRRYSPTEEIRFRLVVKNTSDQTIKNVVVTDTLPLDVVSNISGDGSFDAEKKTVTITINEMKPQEERIFYIKGTIVTADRLPQDQPVICSVNQSNVKVENSQTDEDNATFCIEKEVGKVTKGGKPVHEAPKVTTTPPTGPEVLALIPLMGSGIVGFILRRKA